MVWFAVWCASAWAADAAGATDEAYLSGSTISFGNVSVKAANGDLWFAGEFVDPTVSTTDPGIKVVWCQYSPSPACNQKTLQATGLLTNNGVYPSVMTWSNAADVLVTGKVDERTGQPHLRV